MINDGTEFERREMIIRKDDLVRIGRNKRVYRVHVAPRRGSKGKFYLEADANHPDAAKRVPDAFRWYDADELTPVNRDKGVFKEGA